MPPRPLAWQDVKRPCHFLLLYTLSEHLRCTRCHKRKIGDVMPAPSSNFWARGQDRIAIMKHTKPSPPSPHRVCDLREPVEMSPLALGQHPSDAHTESALHSWLPKCVSVTFLSMAPSLLLPPPSFFLFIQA